MRRRVRNRGRECWCFFTEIFIEGVYVFLKVVENESTASAAVRSRGAGWEHVCQKFEKQLEDVERQNTTSGELFEVCLADGPTFVYQVGRRVFSVVISCK